MKRQRNLPAAFAERASAYNKFPAKTKRAAQFSFDTQQRGWREGCRRVASSLVVAGAFTQSSLAPHSLLQPREADFRTQLAYILFAYSPFFVTCSVVLFTLSISCSAARLAPWSTILAELKITAYCILSKFSTLVMKQMPWRMCYSETLSKCLNDTQPHQGLMIVDSVFIYYILTSKA